MSKIENAQQTCEGLNLLIRRLNAAAIDLDNGGQSAHEIFALLASTTDCINNLSSQLQSLDQSPADASNVSRIKQATDNSADDSVQPASGSTARDTASETSRAAVGRY